MEPIRDKTRVNLEHILPLSPNPKHWKIKPEDAEPLQKKIGNLTLMATKANSDSGNDSFKSKKNAYKDSHLKITKRIATDFDAADDWNADTILERQKWLATKAVETWPLTFDD